MQFIARKYAIGHIKPGKVENDHRIPSENFDSGLIAKADSLAELGEKLGINGQTLEQTVREFNEHAVLGKDPQFHRGENQHDRYYADQKVSPQSFCGGRCSKHPFYALRCDPGDLDTKGGLDCDEHGRVLDTQGDPY